MLRKTLVAAGSAAAMSLAGCASAPNEIQAQYVSPVQYESYDCQQVSVNHPT